MPQDPELSKRYELRAYYRDGSYVVVGNDDDPEEIKNKKADFLRDVTHKFAAIRIVDKAVDGD